MVSLKYGPLIADARGSILGTTFSRARSGATARGRPRPPIPHRPYQLLAQGNLAVCAYAWTLVSSGDKSDWDTYASTVTLYNRLGEAFNPTGQQAFMRVAMFVRLRGLTETPPTYYDATTLAGVNIPSVSGLSSNPVANYDLNGDDLRIASWSAAPNSDDTILYTTYIAATARPAAQKFLFYIQDVDGSDAPPITIAPDLVAAFASGQVIRARVASRTIDTDGRVANLRVDNLELTVP